MTDYNSRFQKNYIEKNNQGEAIMHGFSRVGAEHCMYVKETMIGCEGILITTIGGDISDAGKLIIFSDDRIITDNDFIDLLDKHKAWGRSFYYITGIKAYLYYHAPLRPQ